MTTNRDVLVDAERRLQRAEIDNPAVDAAEILAFVLGVTRNRLHLHDDIGDETRIAFERLLAKRLNRIPLQHLTGVAPFRHIELAVGPGVFIPRPETELVTEAAIRHLKECIEPIAVDLCAGSGAIAISLAFEVPGTRVTAVELSADAFPWLTENVQRIHTKLPVTVVNADATDEQIPELVGLIGMCDVVTCNPPYIPAGMVPRDPEVRDHEPEMALYGGNDGLDVVRGILGNAALLLKSGGLLVIEHADVQGPDSDTGSVVDVVQKSGFFANVNDRQDYNQRPRFTVATRI